MRYHQQGMSYVGYMLLAVFIGVAIKITTTLIPPYLDFHSYDASIRGAMEQAKGSNPSPGDMSRAINSQLQVEGISLGSPSDMVITKDGNVTHVMLKYDVTRPFFGNMDIIFHFNKTYSSESTSE